MITKSQIQTEIDETAKDLAVFREARRILQERVQEVSDYPVPRLLPDITAWSGTGCVLGGLDLTVHSLERTLDELKSSLEKAAPDQPFLRLVESE